METPFRLSDQDPEARLKRLEPSQAEALEQAGDALVAEAGLEWQASEDINLGVAYEGQIGSRAQEHTLKGSFVWSFGTY